MQIKRYAMDLLIDWIENPYHCTLLSGINAAAEELDINILVFVGGTPHSKLPAELWRTIIYDFVGKNNVDGLIIAAGSVGRCSTIQELGTFCIKYLSLPIVTIAQNVADFPVIRTDGKQGLKDLVFHLIDEHNKKNIAFISGPESNQDSRENRGTGLGLHLIYNIVKQRLGGTITIKSEYGNGVCFTITIPLNINKIENGNHYE